MNSAMLLETRETDNTNRSRDGDAARSTRAAAAIERMRRCAEASGLPMFCVEISTGVVLANSSPDFVTWMPVEVSRLLAKVRDVEVIEHSAGALFYLIPLPEADRVRTVAIGYVLTGSQPPAGLVLAAAQNDWTQERFDTWVAQQIPCPAVHLYRLLDMAVLHVDHEAREAALQLEIEELGDQLEETYEEISLLHALTRNLQISRSPNELAELCLNRLHPLIESEGSAVWIEEESGKPQFLVKGTVPFDSLGMERLIARFQDHTWSRPLVKNRIEGTLLGADFPGLRNLLIVPIAEGVSRSGWILCCNVPEGREFGTVEASLLNSLAAILGTHVRNIELYRQHQELLLSFVRSLVSTLDAKDTYTRGHSQRVALIARRLGEVLSLPAEDLQDIYLSGLLHDVGKIGVDDRILRKPGELTEEEFAQIQTHPMIGYNILEGLQNLREILPGVRNHHENYDGTGYPDRLSGEGIPLMARILAVADAYDAMGSDRPYRRGMPLERIESIFRAGAGRQWDPKVIDAYFEARDEISVIAQEHARNVEPMHKVIEPGKAE